MIDEVISEFGQGLGLSGLALNQTGNLELVIGESSDRLQLQQNAETLLVCFAIQHHERESLKLKESLLALTHQDNEHPHDFQVAYVGEDTIVLIARLKVDEINADILTDTFNFLWEIRQGYLS
jgi:type III secretion system chaperone SycN